MTQGLVKLATGRLNDQCELKQKRLQETHAEFLGSDAENEIVDTDFINSTARLDRIRSANRLGEVFLTLEEFEWLTM